VPVIPVQALTAVVLCSLGLTATWFFLGGRHSAAFAVTVILSQVWRLYSETLRADYRGGGDISAYQVLAGFGIIYAWLIVSAGPAAPAAQPDILAGLSALWSPAVLLALQLLWVGLFLFAGRSTVTGSILSFHVHEDRLGGEVEVAFAVRKTGVVLEPERAGIITE
jgi:hypothetical protein